MSTVYFTENTHRKIEDSLSDLYRFTVTVTENNLYRFLFPNFCVHQSDGYSGSEYFLTGSRVIQPENLDSGTTL